MSEKKETFQYTYSAERQEEIKTIREKYVPHPKEEDKMEQLRKLDGSVTRPGTIVSLAIGIVSTLLFGVGMCCFLVWDGQIIPGVICGVVGVIGMLVAPLLCSRITKKRREKLAPEILRLSEELMK